jgi:antitoxin FitA
MTLISDLSNRYLPTTPAWLRLMRHLVLSFDSEPDGEIKMPQLLVRDVPMDVVVALKKRAAEHGRSAEAEHRAILEQTLRPDREGFWERAAMLREKTRGRTLTPSEELIRQARDER